MLDDFIKAYIECALWSSTDDDGPLDSNFGVEDIAPEAMTTMRAECEAFYTANAGRFEAARIGDSQAGHDFWLTRNRHGAGFWDRDTGPVIDALTDAAHAAGESDLYVGDDGRLYVN